MATKITTLTDQVAQRLQDEIQRGIHEVGAKLPSGRELGKIFGVSQAVIREATERLRSQGLIDSRQGSGCIVKSRIEVRGFRIERPSSDDRHDLAHVFELRLDLESAAAGLASVRRTDADLAALAAVLSRLENNLYDLDAGIELDIAFHTAVAAATHNPHYLNLLNYLNRQLRQAVHAARHHALTHAPLPETVQREHVAIYEAIRARDPQAAHAAVLAHLGEAAVHLGLDLPQREAAADALADLTASG